MKIGEQQLAFLETRQIGGDRLLDLDDHVGLLVNGVGVGKDRRAGDGILVVTETASVAGTGLHVDLVPV